MSEEPRCPGCGSVKHVCRCEHEDCIGKGIWECTLCGEHFYRNGEMTEGHWRLGFGINIGDE